MHSNQHLALAKILAFYDPSPPILLQLLSKKKYFHPAGLPCNKISQNLCVNLQTGQFSGFWALPAVIYSFMWHLFPAQWHWQGLQLWPGQCGHVPREPRAPAPVEGLKWPLQGAGGRGVLCSCQPSILLAMEPEPFPQGYQLSSLCNSVFLSSAPSPDKGLHTQTKLTEWIPETLDGCKFQFISMALI